MRKFYVLLCAVLCSLTCSAQTPTTSIVRSVVYKVGFDSWTSTNKEDGSMSDHTITFNALEGDTISFDWVTSTEEYCDKLVVICDGNNILTQSGENSGKYDHRILSDGEHSIRFIYAKDYFSSVGNDEVKISNITLSSYRDSLSIDEYECIGRVEHTFHSSTSTYSFKYTINADEGDSLSVSFINYSYIDENSGKYNVIFLYDDGKYIGQFNLTGIGAYGTYYSPFRKCALHAGANNLEFRPNPNAEQLVYVQKIRKIKYMPLQRLSSFLLEDGKYTSMSVAEKFYADDFSYVRTFNNAKWQSLYVPFSISYDDWNNDFEVAKINDVNMYDTDGDGQIDDTEIEIIKVTKGTLKPNHPYLIKAKKAGEKILRLSNAIIYPTEENTLDVSSAEMKYTFIGTYNGVSGKEMVDNHYYAMAGGSLSYTEDENVSLKPYRWYMKAESRDGQVILPNVNNSRIRVKVYGEDDELTGIEEFDANDVASGCNMIYSLDGRVVSTNGTEGLGQGIYISNGKKIIVK